MTAHPEWKLGLIDFGLVRLAVRRAARKRRSEENRIRQPGSLHRFRPGPDGARTERRKYLGDVRAASTACRFAGLHLSRPQRLQSRRSVLITSSGRRTSSTSQPSFPPGTSASSPASTCSSSACCRRRASGSSWSTRRSRSDGMLQSGDWSSRSSCSRSISPSSERWRIWSVSSTTSASRTSRRRWTSRISGSCAFRPAALKRLNGRIAQVHVSDCDGVNHGDLPPGRGNTPFGEYMSAIRDAGFAGAASVELEFPPDISQMRDWVAEAYASTLKEMKAVGVH